MTTIIGVQTNKGCELLADNQVTDDSGRIYRHPKMLKMVSRGSYIIAGAGEVAPCDIAQHIWNPPSPTK